jgi:hypothetical protein
VCQDTPNWDQGYPPRNADRRAEHLTDRKSARLDAKLTGGRSLPRGHHRLAVLPDAPQHLPPPLAGGMGVRGRGDRIVSSCPIAEVDRFGRRQRTWKAAVLGLLGHQRRLQWIYRSDQRRHRTTPRIAHGVLTTRMPTRAGGHRPFGDIPRLDDGPRCPVSLNTLGQILLLKLKSRTSRKAARPTLGTPDHRRKPRSAR